MPQQQPPVQVTDWSPAEDLRPIGNVVLVVVDIQGGGIEPVTTPGEPPRYMPGKIERCNRSVDLVEAFRQKNVPVVFIQEVHKPSLVDIGRELDGNEGPHCIEGRPETELHPGLDPTPDEYLIQKRRYSAFFGTELDLVLRGFQADTLLLIGGMTDVCIHYTALDAHQHDYHFRTISDLVGGSSIELHEAALRSMKYLQRDSLVSSESVYRWLESI